MGKEAQRGEKTSSGWLQPAQSAILSAMNRIAIFCATVLAAGLGISAPVPGLADDSAASIAAGGLVPRRETRIVMAKEVLRISLKKVIVDYDFRNDTDADISTEIAFPIPDYSLEMEDRRPSEQGFDNFKLWVDQKPVHYAIEAKAMLKGQDYSALLRSMGVDVASYGHSIDNDTQPQIDRLSKAQKERLAKVGLIDHVNGEYGSPNWKVRKKYYWSQTFPAHSIVHIRHEYTPDLGNSNTVGLGTTPKEDSVEARSVCIDPGLRNTVSKYLAVQDNESSIFYVDFILTTANTWKTPIEDFTLVVERPHPQFQQAGRKLKGESYVSFCWNGPVMKTDADHFSAHLTNFVPSKELRIGFINLDSGWANGEPY